MTSSHEYSGIIGLLFPANVKVYIPVHESVFSEFDSHGSGL